MTTTHTRVRGRGLGQLRAAALVIMTALVAAVLVAAPSPVRARVVDEPSLLFSAADVPALRTKVAADPAAQWWATIQHRAQLALTRDVTTTCERQLRYDLPDLAFAYLITGEERYGNKTREVLVNVAAAPRWHPNSDNPTCRVSWGDYGWRWPQLMAQTAFAYDWLSGSGLLSDADHQAIRADLRTGGRIIYEALTGPEYADAQGYRNLTNYRLRNDAGLGIIGLALRDSVEGSNWSTYAWEDLFGDTGRGTPRYLAQMASADGIYKEGLSYYQDSFRLLIPYFVAMQRLEGVNAFDRPRVRALFTSEAHLLQPDGNAVTVDTGFRPAQFAGGFGHWVAGQYPDHPELLWAWQRARQPVPAGDQWYAVAFYPPQLADDAAAPSTSPSRFWTDGGYALLRSDWSPDANSFLLNAEHLPDRSPHEQADQSSFALFAKGAYLAVDPGDGRHCGGERHYQIRSSQAHNLVLVDGSGPRVVWDYTQTLDPATLDRTVDTERLDYARLQMRYDATDAAITRRALMVDNRYYLVLDDLQATSSHEYTWQLHHGPGGSVTVDGAQATYETSNVDGEPVQLQTHISAQGPADLTLQQGWTNYLPGQCNPHSVLQANTSGEDTDYAAVLYPRGDDGPNPRIHTVKTDDGRATVVETSDQRDVVISNTSGQTADVAGLSTDARWALVSGDASPAGIYVEHGQRLQSARNRLLTTTNPVDLVASYQPEAVIGWVGASEPTRMFLATGGRDVAEVRVDGEPVRHKETGDQMVTFEVPRSARFVVQTR